MKYLLTICLIFSLTSAQWSSDPAAPQSLGSGVQAQVAATSDGGVYIAWLTDGNYHVYIQRLDAAGEAQFEESGMLVSDQPNSSWIAVHHMNLAVDGNDNAIISTLDTRTGLWQVYAYKISPDGSMIWGEDGLVLSASGVESISPRLTVLPDNSVVVTWTHNWNAISFQRVSSDGELLWGDGILIEDDDEDATLISPQPIVTAEGDVLIQWIRQSGPYPWAPDSELYLQKYDYDGNPLWSEPTIAVGPEQFPNGNWLQESVAESSGGSFSAWTDFSGSGGNQNAVAQHITGDGGLSWTGGVDLSTNTSNFRISPRLTVAEESQELMAVWGEANGTQSQHGVYAQRLDSNGNRLWGSYGTAVVGMNSDYVYLDLSVAGFDEELITAYIQQYDYTDSDIYATRLDADGNSVWLGGSATVTNSGNPKSDMMIGKGPGYIFIAWTENGSVYAHCLREDGTLGAPEVVEEDHLLEVPGEYATIQEAISAAIDGDTVLVSAGTYVENIVWSATNGIKLIGSGEDDCIIDGDSLASVIRFEEDLGGIIDTNTLITGFTIQNGYAQYTQGEWSNGAGGGINCYSSSPSLENVTVTGNSANEIGGGILFGESNPSFSSENRCNIYSNTINNSSRGAGADIYSVSSSIVEVIVDTFTVMIPNDYYASPIDSFTFDILHSIVEDSLINEDVYVSVDGDDSNIGTSPELPFKTIKHSLERIYSDSLNVNTIHLASGIYSPSTNGEVFPIGWNNYVNLSGSGEGETILDADNTARVMRFNAVTESLVENITITNGSADEWYGGGIYCYTSSPTLMNVTITGNSGPTGGGIMFDESSPRLENVTITGNSGNFGGGIYCFSSSPTLVNTISWGNAPNEIEFDSTSGFNSITISYSDIQGGEAGIVTNDNGTVYWEEGNIDADPLFCDPDSGDYTLAENSPCVGTGENGANMGAFGVGCEDILSTDMDVIPLQYVLHQNYPNPFNPVTTIRFDLPEDADVQLLVYDVLGREVAELVSGRVLSGFHEVIWDASDVSSGVYLCQLTTLNSVITNKMVVVK